jgi:hypothetical protein
MVRFFLKYFYIFKCLAEGQKFFPLEILVTLWGEFALFAFSLGGVGGWGSGVCRFAPLSRDEIYFVSQHR